MNLENKLSKVREYLAASPEDLQRRIEEEYRECAPSKDTNEYAQIVWHIEMLEEQISRMSGKLLLNPVSDYSMKTLFSSQMFTVMQLCIEYVAPIVSHVTNERFQTVWKEFVALAKTVQQSNANSESAKRACLLMYLCAYDMGMTLNIKAVDQKRLANDEIADLLSTKIKVVTQNGVLDVRALSQLVEDMRSERARLERKDRPSEKSIRKDRQDAD